MKLGWIVGIALMAACGPDYSHHVRSVPVRCGIIIDGLPCNWKPPRTVDQMEWVEVIGVYRANRMRRWISCRMKLYPARADASLDASPDGS